MWRVLILAPILLIFVEKQDKSPNAKVFDKVADSVVGIMARGSLGDYTGAGVIIDHEGENYIITSSTIIQDSTEKLRVWTRGPKRYDSEKEFQISKDAKPIKEVEIVGVSTKEEIAILKITKPRQILKPIKFADSDKCTVGEVVYAVGNAGMFTKSIIDNDEPTFQMGLLSGYYIIKESKQAATYKGYLFETTALFNPKMEGGPLVNTKGEMIGLLTPNYSPHRFVGHAIPVNGFKHRIKQIIEEYKRRITEIRTDAEGYLGLKVKEKDGKVIVDKVEKESPADKIGLRSGDWIVKIGDKEINKAAEFDEFVKGLKSGSIVKMTVDIDGLKQEIQITLVEKK